MKITITLKSPDAIDDSIRQHVSDELDARVVEAIDNVFAKIQGAPNLATLTAEAIARGAIPESAPEYGAESPDEIRDS